jgi:hypothetical protein
VNGQPGSGRAGLGTDRVTAGKAGGHGAHCAHALLGHVRSAMFLPECAGGRVQNVNVLPEARLARYLGWVSCATNG